MAAHFEGHSYLGWLLSVYYFLHHKDETHEEARHSLSYHGNLGHYEDLNEFFILSHTG